MGNVSIGSLYRGRLGTRGGYVERMRAWEDVLAIDASDEWTEMECFELELRIVMGEGAEEEKEMTSA